MKRMKRILALTLSAVLLLALLCACGGNENSDTNVTIDINALWDEITALGEMPAMMPLTDDDLNNLYGIDPADLESYVASVPMMNVHATEFFIAKVKDGKMDTVKSALQSRQAALDTQWSQYLPDQYALVQNYKLTTRGSYIIFAVSQYAEQAEKLFNDAKS